ncbi:3D-(3,5/4)-trihydroxycyclohexane-1,2-dione acylhydrolase (decyclizing) [Gordonia sp. PP30]|uniref:3D-(3,5/4)-trihydroxycyclohexane-1,2-dione acylhydrolase (decyclizing) n=1 Tax=Gordonia sp. PP30 TaxID=2935861 RepID=UPI001FFE802B|nr:3D-(3,5/4)-trihydroxycyclohexane-1,2-dione acylhydrolase (decyclizing) [Gordonia sp. PP30]UQE74911.1 3D-(3,5/4)-trihydroxycyclohexane-1,2-dione acylhydrolase (decyclizing) [Gordonia sp. PP30]
MMTTRRLTVAQALVTFLGHQWTVDGDIRERTVAGVLGIFGHGNLSGIGQALLEGETIDPGRMPYHQARNEQAMVHQAVGYARMHRRRATLAATASVGPGAANMLTGAALATANRLPALLLVADTFATRVADPVLQQLEHPHDPGLQVADAFRPLSRFFGRIDRPQQLYSVALAALRVLTDPAETGAVTLVLPEDTATEALDVPVEFLADRDWHLRRPPPERGAIARAAATLRAARRPMIVAGGGVIYSGATDALRAFAEATGIPVATTQAGGGSLPAGHPLHLGGLGATGSAAANAIAATADVVVGIGTRYSDFTTASRSAFGDPGVVFVNLNVAPFDAAKHGSPLPLVADAREGLAALHEAVADLHVPAGHTAAITAAIDDWARVVDRALVPRGAELPGQPEIIGAVLAAVEPADVVVAAAGSLPGDLQKLWRPRDPLGYHVEYGFSCMGYEIAGGLGAKRGLLDAGDDRDVIVLVGDGSYLMLSSELATAAAEGIRLIVVLIQNDGFASIGALSESIGSGRYGTRYPGVDLVAHARGYGCAVVDVPPGPDVCDEVRAAVVAAKRREGPTVVHVRSDPLIPAPDGHGWWDVPVAEVSALPDTRAARAVYDEQRRRQRPLLGGTEGDATEGDADG